MPQRWRGRRGFVPRVEDLRASKLQLAGFLASGLHLRLLGEMASHLMLTEATQLRQGCFTGVGAERTTAVETAGVRIGIDRAHGFAFETQPRGSEPRHRGN